MSFSATHVAALAALSSLALGARSESASVAVWWYLSSIEGAGQIVWAVRRLSRRWLLNPPEGMCLQMVAVDSMILAHTETMRLSSAELARQLVQHLGATVVAVLAGVRDKKLPYKWASDGGPVPRDGALQRLQVAHRAWVAVATAEGADIARAWFIGANPRLDEQPPFMALADGKFKPVMSAAAAFVDGTDN